MSALDGKGPRYLLAVLTHMAHHHGALPKRELQAHGTRALRRAAKRRRYAANTRRLERNGWRAFHEEEKRRAARSLVDELLEERKAEARAEA